MDYENKYKQALSRATFYSGELLTENQRKILVDIFPELKESESELTWLKSYIKEEAQCLSMDIRDTEDSKKLEKLQKSLAWLEKQGEKKNTRKREIDDAYLQGICDAKHEIEKQGEQLNPDKVIEWLECKAFQGWAEEINIKQIVNKFKKDFRL